MKYTLILAAALCFASCSKKKCWTCVTSTAFDPIGYTKKSIDTSVLCDKTQKEIDEYIGYSNSISRGVDSKGDSVRIIHTATCSKN